MKKIPHKIRVAALLLGVATLSLLTGCMASFREEACHNEDTRRISWDDTIDVRISECWTSTDSKGVLTFKKEDQSAQVVLQKTEPAEDSPLILQETFELYTGETLYALVSNPEDKDSLNIVDSIQVKSWSIAATSCEAPEEDFAQFVNHTWQKITFALPFCWGVEESQTMAGDHQLLLYRNEENGKYTRVNFWSNYGLPQHYMLAEETTVSGIHADVYTFPNVEGTTETSTVYILDTTPIWTIETNAPQDPDVGLILNSLIIAP